ncbi:MAG: right-handed parallel beta-helix repeat-containing protein [Candidatus Moduliflexus flocculans]|nr:right-handed parallel beta-helix repeat-containing protein [Candidatus Moduliflexus flocculans]
MIRGDVEILGFGAAASTLEAASRPEEAADRVLRVEEGGRLYLSGLTVRAGRPSDRLLNGGGIANYGALVIEDCGVIENQASAGAGIWTAGPLEIRRSVIAANRTVMRPAADYTAAVGCQGSGAGIKVDKPGSARIEDCLIAWNDSLKGGGGIHVACETEVRLSRSTIFGNSAKTRGGGIDLSGGTLALERCTVAGNVSTGKGFAVHNRGRLSLSGCLLASESGTRLLSGRGFRRRVRFGVPGAQRGQLLPDREPSRSGNRRSRIPSSPRTTAAPSGPYCRTGLPRPGVTAPFRRSERGKARPCPRCRGPAFRERSSSPPPCPGDILDGVCVGTSNRRHPCCSVRASGH